MAAADTVAALAAFRDRGAGTDAERRAAAGLAAETATAGRASHLETFWSRPNWALAHAWHAALAVVGSVVCIATPTVGGGLVLAALIAEASDALTGVSPGRALTRERASQNVIGPAPDRARPVRLIVTANYDAGRMGLVHRAPLRRAAAALRRATGGVPPGWRAWLQVTMAGLLVIALLRSSGHTGRLVAVPQLLLTAGLILALALLLELSVSPFGPAAGDNASGVAVAVALVRALDVAPPRHLAVELVLTGAGDGSGTGLAHHLRRHSGAPATSTVVIGLAASGAGDPVWFTADGSLAPLRFAAPLAGLARAAAASLTGARPHRGRGRSPALAARRAGLPAITLGALDARGLAPRSHLPSDRAEAVDPVAMDRVLGLALALVDAIDAEVAPAGIAPAPAAA